jgi:arginase
MDSHTFETTPSGAIHGMPLAVLLGHGAEELTSQGVQLPKVKPEHVALVGIRSFEPGEEALLKSLNVRIYYIEEVQERGLDACMQEALARVSQATAGYGVTIDLDSMDPSDAPGVGSPETNGLTAADLCHSLRFLRETPGLQALEITEYNPHRDLEQRTLHVIEDLIVAALLNTEAAS